MRSRILVSRVVLPFLTFLLLVIPSSLWGDVCSAPPNAIVAENCQAGNPASEWDISGNGDLTIQGFGTDISVNRGQTISFKVKTDAASYHIDIYRIGYYGGNGARRVTTIPSSAITPQTQPACLSDAVTGLTDCGNWGVSASWAVPADAVSGLYIGRLVREDTGGASHMMFIVRDDAGRSDLLYQLSDTQWQAYNNYPPPGGSSLYEVAGDSSRRAYKVSYNRPFTVRGNPTYFRAWPFAEEYPMIRWLEANGYDMSYSSGMDTDRFGSNLLLHKVFISSGHDEYWSGNQRANVEAARDAGVHLAFFSGNESFWKTRWENSIDGTNTPYRTLVTYKETHANAKIDPQDPPTWTGTWRDPRFSPPADGGRPENALSGTIFMVNCCAPGNIDPSIVVPAEDGQMRFWRNTTVATQPPGGSVTLGGATIGYEWDEDLDNGFRPAGLFRLSSTDVSVSELLLDFGSTYGPGQATHHLTMYKAASGARVFGAGTVRWSWGLDGTHDYPDRPGPITPDIRVQQATVNLFADMGSQPGSLQPGLVAATASTDTTPPASFITGPAAAVVGTPVAITGTAADTGSGVVGGVEVSADGGPWHPASGRSSWAYSWTPTRSGNINIRSRAVDDSGNLETPSIGVTVNVAPRTCPCSIWNASTVPQTASTNDTNAVEVGVKFRSSVAGFISGVRFYKGPLNTGTHIGNLWTANGTNLARATFSSESASGWQQVNFATPVAISANTTYVASYFAPVGGYASNSLYFRQGVDNEPLRALADGEDGANGVFLYAGVSSFPTQTFNSTNYWVDVVFSTTASVPPLANNDSYTVSQGQTLGVAAPGVLANDVAQNPNPLSAIKASDPTNGTLFFNSDGSFTYTPNPSFSGTDSFTYRASDGTLTSGLATVNITVNPSSGSSTTIWSPSTVPGTADANDNGAVELGVKFRASVAGSITGVRFYKGPLNTGTHIGNLWSSSGTLLATATFTTETASGWQQVNFAAPVAINANTTYVASYFAPVGQYSFNGNYFTTGVTNGPLHALANSEDPPGNGVYHYASTSSFPTQTFNSTNYWVDVVFTSASSGNPVANNDSYTTTQGQALTIVAPGVLSNDTAPSSNPLAAIKVSDPANGTLTLSANGAFTYTPLAAFSGTDSFTYRATDGTLTSNLATVNISVTPSGGTAVTIWTPSTVPGTADANDNNSVELGVKFSANVSGVISGVRFYKGPSNTGTHVGNLWSSSGTLLASATFTNETASGWQQVNFATPISIQANTTYVASYFAPLGQYAFNGNYFTSGVTNGPLHALANSEDQGGNGVYHYGSTSGFPLQSFNATNYWVDVVFSSGSASPPVANNDSYTTQQGQPLIAAAPGVLTNDTAPSGNPLSAAKITDPANGTLTLNSNGSFTYTPNAGFSGSDSFTYRASDGVLNSNTATVSITVTASGGGSPVTIWSPSTVPGTANVSDTGSVELGLKFRSSVSGFVTGARFYKGALNTGTHIANLWSSSGTLLATATFTNETASGWQQVNFASPVAITANTTYVVSYFAPGGRYAFDGNYFSTTGVTNGPLHALGNNEDQGGNGVFHYGSSSSFPQQTFNAGNYWVDVVFTQ
jgi:hypothetical protein